MSCGGGGAKSGGVTFGLGSVRVCAKGYEVWHTGHVSGSFHRDSGAERDFIGGERQGV